MGPARVGLSGGWSVVGVAGADIDSGLEIVGAEFGLGGVGSL